MFVSKYAIFAYDKHMYILLVYLITYWKFGIQYNNNLLHSLITRNFLFCVVSTYKFIIIVYCNKIKSKLI